MPPGLFFYKPAYKTRVCEDFLKFFRFLSEHTHMKALWPLISRQIDRPAHIYGLVLFLCVFALASAFSAEIFFALEPCRLCITQRYPFAIGAAGAVIGLLLRRREAKVHAALSALLSFNFLTNAGIAFYHSGVERKWWPSDELCRMQAVKEGQSFIENILSAPMGRCDEIPWADPLLGLSMANYNVLLCLGLAALCALCAFAALKRRSAETTA